MASSSIPYVPSPLARDHRNKMNSSSTNPAAAPVYGVGPYGFVPDSTSPTSSSSSKSRLRQPFAPYTGPSGSTPLSFSTTTNNNNNNTQFPPVPGLSPYTYTGTVPHISAPPATGPCPLAQPVDIASLNTPGLDNTSGNDTSVTASPTSPTGTSAQPMYATGYFPNVPMGYSSQPTQSFAGPSSAESSKHAAGGNNNWNANDASDWEDPQVFGAASQASSRMPPPRVPTSFPTDQILPGWAPTAPAPHPFATPTSSSGSPTSPLHHNVQHAPVAHHEPQPPAKKVPRPPNAWILYRSDMLAQIRSGNMPAGLEEIVQSQQGAAGQSSATSASEGEGKKKGKKSAKDDSDAVLAQLGGGKAGRGLPQADISKMISVLWKRESEDVRRRYEHQAEVKKLEHQKLYPNYKFQPIRKEEKLAQRAERAKERDERRREKELYRQRQRRRMRGRHTPPPEDDSHVSAMARSSSYPGQEVQAQAFQMPYGVGWGQDESDGEAMQLSLAQPVSFDTSLLQVPTTFHVPAGMPQIPVGIGLATTVEMPPSPERTNGNTDLASSYPGSSEWAGPAPAAYLASQRALLNQPGDGSRGASNGMGMQFPSPDAKDASIYVFNPPTVTPDIQLTDPEALAALWCKLEPEGNDSLNVSPAAGPTPTYTFPTQTLAQPVDAASWDAYDPSSNTLQVPMTSVASQISAQILRDWTAMNNGNGGMTLTPDFQSPSNQQQQQSNTNFQRTLAPTPSFSAQASPIDATYGRDRPTPWTAYLNTSPTDFGASMSPSGARNAAEAYTGSMTVDANGNMSWHGRNVSAFGPTGADNKEDMDLTMSDMPGGGMNAMNAPNVSIGLPVSITDVPSEAPRVVRRPRQVASKYEAVAGA